MIRSLYTRVVLTFLLAVIAGLSIAFVATWTIFQTRLEKEIEEEVLAVSSDLVESYAQASDQSLDSLRNHARALRNYSIRIIDQSGDILVLNSPYADHGIAVPSEESRRVLNGETVVFTDRGAKIVGRPFERSGESYALFVKPADNSSFPLARILVTFLLIMFCIGGFIFLIASRFMVKPIRRMTDATERMARGDFDVELNLNRRDELGVLAQSFDHMSKELKQIEQMRQDFVSNVSHEIQSPLTSITGFAQALRDGVVSSEHQTRYLGIIAEESKRLSRLSDNLLQLASLDSDHHPFAPTTYALDEQIRQVIVSLEPQWSGKRIVIELELPAVQIVADADQLNQVWINLLSNAIKFTPEGGRVGIELRLTTNEIEVMIADTGIGISPEQINYVFERFYKADQSRNRVSKGSGLGLAIARKIIELHEGQIFVAHSSPDEGTTIKVILPAGR
ncbi:sensor histidine kinase [Paenibacillus aceti]|uniref:Heme sensor protein HssS n=1 Tax=Paenibacillus aceti TaxID=1820010 RepID=A0ABQ1VY44_9BACL|nr:ATP-binding protein [Paenibacillus aceti]GGG03859.1 two-component sensor histidine kinase [Paenibacillus aceti]